MQSQKYVSQCMPVSAEVLDFGLCRICETSETYTTSGDYAVHQGNFEKKIFEENEVLLGCSLVSVM